MNGAPRLMVITDTSVAAEDVIESRIAGVVDSARRGSVVVQLRDRQLPVRRRLVLGRALRELTRQHEDALIVNDRCDLVLLLAAEGVHLGERAVATDDARRLVGERAWVSVACHGVGEGFGERARGATAVVLSPIMAPRKGKPALRPSVLAAARRVLDALEAPPRLFALGGIDATNAGACLEAGADGVAVVGAALDGRNVRPLLSALGIDRSTP